MKPVRTIEKVAYGDGTPDELADNVPTWKALDPKGHLGVRYQTRAVAWSSRSERPRWVATGDPDGSYDDDQAVTVDDDLTHRWWAAVAVAYAAGCPPHWADMGMTPRVSDLWGDVWDFTLNGVEFIVLPMGDGHWRVDGGGSDVRDFTTEFEARCWVADRLGVEWGPRL